MGQLRFKTSSDPTQNIRWGLVHVGYFAVFSLMLMQAINFSWRSATPLGYGSALLSWSGSMFEYLMPSLVMRAAEGSLLEQSNR